MASLFLKLLNMSIAASWLILAVVVLRVVLKRAPKWIHCILWALVGIRLLCPLSIESALSLIPSPETIRPDVVQFVPHPSINSGVTIIDNTVNPVMGEAFGASPVGGVNPLYVWTYLASFHAVHGYQSQSFHLHEFFMNYLRSLQERGYRFQEYKPNFQDQRGCLILFVAV